jgi:adenine phosphoribosyltransferase
MTQGTGELAERIAGLLRDVPDFPQPGIVFKDIAPLLADGAAFDAVIHGLAEAAGAGGVDVVAGIEARGFLIAGALARQLDCGLVPVRKAGKLPLVAASRTYELEYGTATLELPADTIAPGTAVFVIDDVLATGGTAAAACDLLTTAGARVVGFGTLLEISGLGGRERLGALAQPVPVHALLTL